MTIREKMKKTRLWKIGPDKLQSLVAVFENPNEAEKCAILFSMGEVFDYEINGKRWRSARRVLCPGCGADWTYNELARRIQHGDHLCDCGTRFYTANLKFNGEKCETYIS